MTTSNYSKRDTYPNLAAALTISILLTGVIASFWELVDILTPFLAPFLILALWILFFIVFFWSILHFIRKKRYKNLFSFTPALLQLITLIIIFTVPFTTIMLDLNFKRHSQERMDVVSQVMSGELKPAPNENARLILLPDHLQHLSKGGGRIMVEHNDGATYVFFFTYRGILDNFSGFMYRSDDTPPQKGDFGGNYFQTELKGEHWYWVASN